MRSTKQAKILKILSGTTYHLLDCQSKSTLIVQLFPTPTKSNYYSILKLIPQAEITYQIVKNKNNSSSNKIKEETLKANIYINGRSISEMYTESISIMQCTEERVYQKDQIVEAYVLEIECLKVKLYLLNENKWLDFYFSELKLPKIQNVHPKELWQKAEQYFKGLFLGEFVQVKINGSQNYREQINVYGEILRLETGLNLKQKILEDGYAELSKNCEKYLSAHEIKKLSEIVLQSKKNNKGLWYLQPKITKGSNQVMEQKYTQWQQLIKKKIKFTDLKNANQQLKLLSQQLKKNSNSKSDPNKPRIILDTILTLFEEHTTEKMVIQLQQFFKNVINCLINIQTVISNNTDNLDFLRYLNKLIIFVLFYVLENQKLGLNAKNKIIIPELQKIVKIIFKCSFIGNETFHQKVFERKKQSDFDTFQFDPAYLSGISSYSQTSDIQQTGHGKPNKKQKAQKKISSAQGKIRINATLVLSSIFKNYGSIVQNHWQICVKSNILTKDFMEYLQKLKISIDSTKMSIEQKKHIVSLMRTNFGDYSLVLLVFFQQNAKVKMNALNCIIHMIGNFQSRKIIDTTEAIYMQKLLNQTKSSFIPKSFLVFSGLRNILYFLLFSLHHQRNILIIVTTFKALSQICMQSTLIDKMGFIEGMGLLMANYISPVLQFSWEVKELIQLKCLCIGFLGALVNTQKKWEQMENQYLLSNKQKNINICLIKVLESIKQKQQSNQPLNVNPNTNNTKQQNEKITNQITKYFKNMTKRYYSAIFHEITPGVSVWSTMENYYNKNPHPIYASFVEQVFKCHNDQAAMIKAGQISGGGCSRKIVQAVLKAESLFGLFLGQFFRIYSQFATSQIYIYLINILTYVPYHQWSEPNFKQAKQFLNHCFNSASHNNTQPQKKYPNLQQLKQVPLVRLTLIKLLGYLSFCKQFQTPQYSTPAIRSLLSYSRLYKSPNTVIKITWGISNWSNIQCFNQGLSENQLKECLQYMIGFCESEKQKIASNCTRGIGFFVNNFGEFVDIQQCINAIIKNLLHPVVKVRINSTKILRMMLNNPKINKNDTKIKQELISILQQNILKNNYQLQTQTLLLIKDLNNPIKQQKMIKIYGHILHDLLNYTTMEYQFFQIKTLKQLRKVVLQQMVRNSQIIHKIRGNQCILNDLYQTIQNFILDSQQQSLRKQAENLKILDRGFEKGQQALNTVFNIKNEKYDEQKRITTEFTMRGIHYEANQQDIELLGKIKEVGKQVGKQVGKEVKKQMNREENEQNKSVEEQKWKYLAQMRIQGRKVCLGRI